jgi:hypothetical protein
LEEDNYQCIWAMRSLNTDLVSKATAGMAIVKNGFNATTKIKLRSQSQHQKYRDRKSKKIKLRSQFDFIFHPHTL